MENVGVFPEGIKAPVQYGESIKRLIGYLSAEQYMPYNRIAGMMKDVFGIGLSEGTVDNALKRLSEEGEDAYKSIKGRLKRSKAVGADGTGFHQNKGKGWMVIWQDKKNSYITASERRDYATIKREFPRGLKKAILVSDCNASQLKTPARGHQICLAHLLRITKNFVKALKSEWASQMKDLLKEAIKLRCSMTKKDFEKPPEQVLAIERKADELLAVDTSGFHDKLKAFIKTLTKERSSIFTFLYHPEVPYDNNASERGIRNVKVKVKVSGQFRTHKGAQRFAVLRSIIDTYRKKHNRACPPCLCFS
jgi:transposase